MNKVFKSLRVVRPLSSCRILPASQVLRLEKWVSLRLSSTALPDAPEAEEPEKVKKKRKPKIKDPDNPSEELLNYFKTENQQKILRAFPPKYFAKKNNTPNHFYCADESVAEIIAKRVTEGCSEDTPILEMNPGCGILTRQLLKSNARVHMMEADVAFRNHLEEIVRDHEKTSLTHADLTSLWKQAHQDKLDSGNRVQKLLDGKLPRTEWTDQPNARIVGGIGENNFFKHLVNSLIYQHSLLAYGRCEMFLLVPPPIYIPLACSREAGYLFYRYLTVLFQIFFEYEFIQKLPRRSFLPWQYDYNLKKHSKLSKVLSIDPDCLYLVRIVPRKEAYELCAPDDMQALWFFVKQNMISRANRVIPALEKWIPHCGPRLIAQKGNPVEWREEEMPKIGDLPALVQPCRPISNTNHCGDVNIFTQFGDLTPSEMLSLFQQFRNWPEYKQSPFLSLMENNLLKMFISQEGNSDDAITIEKPDDQPDKISRL